MSLFSDRTYEALMEEALGRVSETYDKREGSMIFNGNAPCLAEMAQVYIAIDYFLETTYIHSAPREFLVKRAADHHIYPKDAEAALFAAEFNIDVPVGTRFSVDDLNFVVTRSLAGITDIKPKTEGNVIYEVQCETAGTIGNSYIGTMIPIDYVKGLEKAELLQPPIKAGVDEEETEVFRKRVLNELRSIAFGGNRADYRKWLLDNPEDLKEIEGVKAVKIYPAWNNDIKPASLIPNEMVSEWCENALSDSGIENDIKSWLEAVYTAAKNKKLTVGGTVKVVFMTYDDKDVNLFAKPSPELVARIQEAVDPEDKAGEGFGIAPIGHVVSVSPVEEEEITITAKIICKEGVVFDDIKKDVENAVKEYFNELRAQWEDTENLVVRIAHIESRILTKCAGNVVDIKDTKIDVDGESVNENLTLDIDVVPLLKEVINSGG